MTEQELERERCIDDDYEEPTEIDEWASFDPDC